MVGDWFTQGWEEIDELDAAIHQNQLEERHRMEEEQRAFLERIRKMQQESAKRFDRELIRK